jgi:hypothetical protein
MNVNSEPHRCDSICQCVNFNKCPVWEGANVRTDQLVAVGVISGNFNQYAARYQTENIE